MEDDGGRRRTTEDDGGRRRTTEDDGGRRSRLTADYSTSHVGSLVALFRPFKSAPCPNFLDTIKPIEDADAIPDVMTAAEVTVMAGQDRKGVGGDLADDLLPLDNLCSILKYCEEDSDPSFYGELNRRCYNKDRGLIKPFLSFMWLLLKTLELLPPYKGTVVNRGVKLDLKDDYPVGKHFVWHGFISTTFDVGVLEDPIFLGTHGKRTIFQIELTQKQARDISKYAIREEGEVLLPPGCRFKVTGVLSPAKDLTVIQLCEVKSPAWIIDLRPHISIDHKTTIDVFSRFDLNDSGTISVHEMSTVLNDLGMDGSDARRVVSAGDADGSGDLDFREFVDWLYSGSEIAKQIPELAAKPDLFALAEAEPVRPGLMFEVGQHVLISGLKDAQQYNGGIGCVQGFREDGLCEVLLQASLRCLRPLKPPSIRTWLTTGPKHLAQNAGRYYCEVKLGNDFWDTTPQIGWLTTEFEEKENGGNLGVGDDDHGWAADGVRHVNFHTRTSAARWPRKWQGNDVIGLAIDIEGGSMQFSFNGEWVPIAQFSFEAGGRSFFPALSVRGLFVMHIPRATWHFAPPSEEYQALAESGVYSRPLQSEAEEARAESTSVAFKVENLSLITP